jgi:hypothetical protein
MRIPFHQTVTLAIALTLGLVMNLSAPAAPSVPGVARSASPHPVATVTAEIALPPDHPHPTPITATVTLYGFTLDGFWTIPGQDWNREDYAIATTVTAVPGRLAFPVNSTVLDLPFKWLEARTTDGLLGRAVVTGYFDRNKEARMDLASEENLKGTVLDRFGKPLPGAFVSVVPYDPNAASPFAPIPSVARADRDGWFLVRGLTPGRHTVTVEAPDHRLLWTDITTPTTHTVLRMTAGGATVRGRAVRQDNGQPIPGAQILLQPHAPIADQYPPSVYLTANANGEFERHGLLPGQYLMYPHNIGRVALMPQAWMIPESRPTYPVLTLAEGETTAITLQFFEGFQARGVVRSAVDGRPLPGVYLADRQLPTTGTFSDADGLFDLQFNQLFFQPDTRTWSGVLYPHLDGWAYKRPGVTTETRFLPGQSLLFGPGRWNQEGVVVTMTPQIPYRGRILSPAGTPARDARFRVWWIHPIPHFAPAWQDAAPDGTFQSSMAPDAVFIVEAHDEQQGWSLSPRISMEQWGGEQRDHQLHPFGQVTVTVRDEDGNPVPGAEVRRWGMPEGVHWFAHGPTTDHRWTDRTGVVTLRGVPRGIPQTVSITKIGYANGSGGSVLIPPTGDGAVSMAVPLALSRSISGVVLYADGKPAAKVRVNAVDASAGATSDENGAFVITGLTTGTFDLSASLEVTTDVWTRGNLDGVPTGTTTAVVRLDSSATDQRYRQSPAVLRGRLVDQITSKPLTQFQVRAQPSGLRQPQILGPNHPGMFTLELPNEPLPNVQLSAPGYGDCFRPVPLDSTGAPARDAVFPMKRLEQVTGRVVSADGRGLGGVEVVFESIQDMGLNFTVTPAPSALTDASGLFRLTRATGGFVQLKLTRRGQPAARMTLRSEAANSRNMGDILYPEPGGIRVTVVSNPDAGHNPRGAYEVMVRQHTSPITQPMRQTIAATGVAEFDAVPVGFQEVTLTRWESGGQWGNQKAIFTQLVEVKPGQLTEVIFGADPLPTSRDSLPRLGGPQGNQSQTGQWRQ